MPQDKQLLQTIRSNPLPWMVQGIGILVLILNLWLASQLSPILQSLDTLAHKVDAVESDIRVSSSTREEFVIVKTKVETIEANVAEIKTDVREIRNALGR